MDLIGISEASTSRAIDKLASLLIEEPILLTGNQEGIEALRAELQHLRAFLRDAEARSEQNEAVRMWVEQVKEVAELIEDVVDEFVLKASRRRRDQRGFASFLGRAGRLIGTLNNRRNLASNLQNIKELLSEVRRRAQMYGIASDAFVSRTRAVHWSHRHVYYPFENNYVGIDLKARELGQRLTEGESRRSVVSLVGLAGVGKTALAGKVYTDESVRRHFDCCAWIAVSQSYKMEELLRTTAKLIGVVAEQDQAERIEAMDTMELLSVVRNSLLSKRYLLVFDDIWDVHFWQDVKHALPDKANGSRVFITTRRDAVAACCNETISDHVERLDPLSMEVSLHLFRSRVFAHEPDQQIPQELESTCHEIVRLCGGLPLAINAVAGLLSRREKTVREWENLLNKFHFELNSNHELGIVSEVLALSFGDLPYQLKMCFLYFSIFPEDSLIPNEKLTKLWIAEGFVQENIGMTLEEVAKEYLDELISRNMVQACEGFYGLEKFCRVHDLMHNMAQQKAVEFSFCHIQDERNSRFRGKSRRLLICNSPAENVFEKIEGSQVRSVFLSNIDNLNNSFVVTLFGKYKLLTSLDFENVPLDRLSEEVGNLFYLKYLSLKNTQVKRLPKSVGKLLNLQTLDLRNTLLVELPIEINKLRKLRHLLASGYENEISLDATKGVRIKEGIGCLTELQTLMTVEAHLSGMDVIQELKRLKQLRRLIISRLTGEHVIALCACIEGMSKLESLSLYMMNDEILDLQFVSSVPPYLERLILKGFLQSFPDWISSLRTLSVLCLSLSRLSDDPLQHLCHLPNLMSLWLYRAYDGEELHFRIGDFLKLKLLVLREMHRLETVEIEEGALPLLEELRLGASPRLDEVPSGIQHLRNLKVVSFYDMPNEFVHSMQPDGGSEYWKVAHIPSVLFWYRMQGRDYVSYRLGESDLLDHLQGLATTMGNVFQRDARLSFSYSDDEEVDLARLSFSSNPWMSDDDIED